MKSASADATPSVAALLGQLRRRAQLLLALRGLWLGAGIGLLGFALLSALVGPTAGWTLASLAWAIVGGLGLLGVHHGLAPARRYQGSAAARLLEKQGLALASAARSAVELAEASDASASPSLIEAHAREVSARLVGLRPSRIVPWSWLRHWSVGAGMLALALGALLLVGVDRARAGAFALLHPAARDAGGLAVADLIGSSHALLTYPAYLGLPPEERIDPIEIEAPVGTSVLFTLRARVSVEAATLRIAGRDHHMVPDEEEEGAFAARFVVRESGPLRISLREPEGAWLVDMSARRIIAREDEAPRVVLLEPREDPTLELHERLVAQIEADDDHGLEGVFLVLRTPDLEQHRHPIPVPNRPRSLRGEASFSPLDYDLRAGDVVGFWAEAVDADSVGGENVGRSEERRLTIASEASGREAGLSSLEALLDACLEALAERLEGPPPEEEGEARARWQRVRAKGEAFVERAHAADEGERMGTDLGLQLAMGERVDALLAQEIRAHGAALASHARRIRADAALVSEFEEDALALADLLGRLRLRDAAGLARELESLRREMASLLAELRRSDSEEARRALRAALGRARLRLDALRERLAAMQTSVPSEFFNAEAARAEAQRAALDALEGALESGDLDAADRSLLDFRREVDALAQALGAANESYGEARFAERDRAMAEALDMLAGLESEERRLAERSEARRREAGVRALESAGMSAGAETARRLAAEAHRTHQALLEVPAEALGPVERDSFERVSQRLQDANDALSSGDLAEARRMTEEASGDLDAMARDLELSALMFPGLHGETSRAAAAARRAERQLAGLREQMDRAIPRITDHVSAAERASMREDASRQARALEVGEALRELLAGGPEGSPLLPGADGLLDEAREAMERGRRGLERGDPVEASSAQDEAARELTELRERLEREQEQTPSGGQGGGSGSEAQMDQRRVRIHDADEARGPMELRRRLLDAMREDAPAGYETAVRRYYQELLR